MNNEKDPHPQSHSVLLSQVSDHYGFCGFHRHAVV